MAEKRQLEETLYFHNPWWAKESVPAELLEKFKRPVFDKIASYLSLNRILVIKGPRRVGKTSLAYQIIDRLLNQGVPPKDIFFLSFDDPKARGDIDETFKLYETILGRPIQAGGKIYCFLDEVHFLPQWEFFVKKYFDKKYPIKFIISGSAATLIKKSTESLAGRTIEEVVLPFSFFEYLLFKIKDKKLAEELSSRHKDFKLGKRPLPFSPILEQYVNIHLKEYKERGGFPHIFNVKSKSLWHKLLYEDVIEKVVYKDLVDLYDIRQPQILEKLLLYVSGISAQILNISNIADSISLSREYTEKYLGYLENAYLLFTLKKYARSVEKQIRSLEKTHLIDPGLFNILEKPQEGNIIESVLASHLHRFQGEKIYYWRDKFEVDIIYKTNQTIIPIEVKLKDSVKKTDLNGLFCFMEKYHLRVGLVATKDRLDKIKSGGQEIVFIPYWQLMAVL
ncbi:MAG: ATP-binding protein [Candidatus Margulisbacteria bacterium]|nr:ATP-binding protein [Candidatus Margulisiibacteriota bacterium]